MVWLPNSVAGGGRRGFREVQHTYIGMYHSSALLNVAQQVCRIVLPIRLKNAGEIQISATARQPFFVHRRAAARSKVTENVFEQR